jgi:hypothetical protein
VLSNTSGVNTGDQTITLTGDVTGTGTGTFTSTIANSAVTYAKMQNVTAGKLLGSTNSSAAAPGEVTIGSGLSLTNGNLTATGTGGTVTNVNPITVTASGSTFTSTVTNATTTPAIALTIPLASVAGTTAGLLSNTDYTTFNNKQGALTAGAGSGISISGGTISATGITTSNLSSSAGILNAQLANSAITLGSTSMSLGSTNTSIAGLTSVSSTGFTGDLTGNASTATALATARSIYGNNFDGTAALSGVISTTFGGTGASSTSQNFVFAGPTSGAGAPSFRLLTSADVPAGSGNYIANGTTQQTSANFNISGTGVVGTSLSAGSLSLTTALSVANGGTGASTLTGLIKGNGTGAMTAAVAGTDFVAPNSAITGATKTKITYDAKGLVTAGADATTADIAPSTDRNYVTDIKAGVLSNTTGTNTGDQTITLTGDVTGTGTGTFTSTIANSAVTYAKMQNVGANKLVGSINSTSAAVAGEVSIGTGLSLTNGTLTATGTGGTVTNVNPITLTTTGSTFTSTVANATTTPAITLNIPSASVTGTTAGLLSKADYDIFNAKVAPNTAITGATKTKITFDAKGLVTAGADATTADIAPSTDRNYVTDIKAGVLSNTSGTNTGDQTITLTGDVTGTGTGTFTSTIANSAVTYAKMQNIAAGRLLGSISASEVAPGAVAIGTGLSLTNGTLTATGTGGTVTNVSPIIVTASGSTFTSTVTNATTTPVIALTIPLASESGTTAGLLSKTDYDIFNAKQSALSLGAGVQTFMATPSSANLANTITDETGTGKLVFATSPTLETPTLGNATATSLSSGTLTLTTALSAANGGTSQSTYAKGDILYASAANTLSKLTIGSEGQVLVTTSTGIPSWGSNGLYSLNSISATTHSFPTPTNTTSSDIGWSSSTLGAHTLNIPDATTSKRGTMSVSAQTFAGDKTFQNDISANGIFIGKGTNSRSTNLAIGYNAGDNGKNFSTTTTTSAINNIAIGVTTLSSLVDGYSNNAVGNGALSGTNGGYQNNAFGLDALKGNTGGYNNSGFGNSALQANSTGDDNTAVGYNSLVSTTGDKNTAIGSTTNVSAGKSNSTAIGFGATVSENNTIQLGNTEVTSVVTSGTLSATGAVLGTLRVTGGSGTAGRVLTSDASGNATWQAASLGITGVGTITTTSYAEGAAVSANSLVLAPASANFGGVVSTFTQTFAGAKTFNSDIVVNGLRLGKGAGSGTNNFAIGSALLLPNTTGSNNTAIGQDALKANTTGNDNTAIGIEALKANMTGNDNIAIGKQALLKNTTIGSFNGHHNLAMGSGTLYENTTGNNNAAIGYQALFNNTTGNNNIAIGYLALRGTVSGTGTGSYNFAIGREALYNNTTGANNIAIGYEALKANTTGNNNTALGYQANVASTNLTNTTAIGANASVSASNTIQLGNTEVTSVNTSGALTTGAVTYPIAHGTNGQVLSTTGSGTLTWTAPSSGGVTTISGGTTGLTPATATSGDVTLAGTLTATNGGTGQSTYSTGDILYASATNTVSKLTIGSEGQVLIAGSTGVPYWGSNGLSNLNGVTISTQTFATPSNTTTSDIGWSSNLTTGAHTLNIPDAGVSRRGTMGISSQTFRGDKTFENDISANGIFIGKGTNSRSTNLAIGYNAGDNGKNFSTNTTTSAINNIAIGITTLTALTNGTNNNAIGFNALKSNTTGGSNNAFGANALTANIAGSNNTAIGEGALSSNNGSAANNNTAVGWSSLNANSTGSQNTALGSSTNITGNRSNSTAIGFGATVSTDNTIQLGNTSVTDVRTSGKVTASQFVVNGGTETQVLMANGSYGTIPAAHYVGESYGGGIVFYVYDNGQHGLIAATTNQSTAIMWGSSTLIRANGDGVGAGRNNTTIIAAYNNVNRETAASKCTEYQVTVGGVRYGDWYLPSYHELVLLYNQRSLSGLNMTNNVWYWSSTESNSDNAYIWKFDPSYTQSHGGKSNQAYVRAIRQF